MKKLKWDRELSNQFWSAVTQSRLRDLNFITTADSSLLRRILQQLSSTDNVLDFGAGDGELAGMLIEHGISVGCFEPSPGRQEVIKSQPFSSSPLFLGVFDTTVSRQFDAVITLEVLEHVLADEYDDILGFISSITRKGGKIIVSVPNNEDLELSSSYCPTCNSFFHRWQHQRSYTIESLTEDLHQHGFERMHAIATDFGHAEQAYIKYDMLSRAASSAQQDVDKLLPQLSSPMQAFGLAFDLLQAKIMERLGQKAQAERLQALENAVLRMQTLNRVLHKCSKEVELEDYPNTGSHIFYVGVRR